MPKIQITPEAISATREACTCSADHDADEWRLPKSSPSWESCLEFWGESTNDWCAACKAAVVLVVVAGTATCEHLRDTTIEQSLTSVISLALRSWRGEHFHFPSVEDAEGLPRVEKEEVELEVEETDQLARTLAAAVVGWKE